MKKVKLAIVGSRGITNSRLLEEIIDEYLRPEYEIIEVISGGAKGVDSLAEDWADSNGIDKRIFLADWKKYGKSAGYRRNHDIIKNSDFVLVLWDGESRGTRHDISLMKTYNKEGKIFIVKDNETYEEAEPSYYDA